MSSSVPSDDAPAVPRSRLGRPRNSEESFRGRPKNLRPLPSQRSRTPTAVLDSSPERSEFQVWDSLSFEQRSSRLGILGRAPVKPRHAPHTVFPAKAGIQFSRTVNGASLPFAGLLLPPVSLRVAHSPRSRLDSGFRRRDETKITLRSFIPTEVFRQGIWGRASATRHVLRRDRAATPDPSISRDDIENQRLSVANSKPSYPDSSLSVISTMPLTIPRKCCM